MPVPTTIDQLSTTAASNYPAGSDSPSTLDDVQRAHASFVATIRDTVGLGTGSLVPATARTNFGAAASGANSDITSLSGVTSINSGYLYGNRIKNANKLIAQRGTSATVTAGTAVPTASTGYYTVDRFYGYSTGANVTVAQVAGSDNTNKRVQYTGAASVTAIGHGTRLEASETAHMAGSTATYSVELANSLLTTVTWTAYYATTADTFGTVGTPTKTQIATGSFTVTSTVTKYSTQITMPAGATTGVEIVLTVGAQTSGTWTIGREDFRVGSVSPTYFEVPDAEIELLRCQRTCYVMPCTTALGIGQFVNTTTNVAYSWFKLPVTMKSIPVLTYLGANSVNYVGQTGSGVTTVALATTSGPNDQVVFVVTGAGFTAGQAAYVTATASLTGLVFNAEIP